MIGFRPLAMRYMRHARGAPFDMRVGLLLAIAFVVPGFVSEGVRAQSSPPECIGDCYGDGAVTIDELVTGINIALGSAGVEQCPSFDANHDGFVTVDEMLQAVSVALNGCPGVPTRTPSLSPPPTPTTAGPVVSLRDIKVAFKMERGGTYGAMAFA